MAYQIQSSKRRNINHSLNYFAKIDRVIEMMILQE